MRRNSPKKDPPIPNYPKCMNCGSRQVTPESVDNGAPLCEEHDSELAREQYRIKRRIDNLSDALNDVQYDIIDHPPESDETERLRNKRKGIKSKLSAAREKLNGLQENCDHENADRDEQTVTEEDLGDVHPKVIQDAPFTEVFIMCHDCGHHEVVIE